MRHPIIAAATVLSLLSACDASTDEAMEQREGLLFGLTQDDVQELHDRYVPDEDIDLITERLTAPFDCALYDDLCDQVGVEQAIEYTSQLVDLGLEGVSEEELETFSDEFLLPAMDLRDELEAEGDVPRSSTGWVTNQSGNVRLRARNGITTPVIGSRQAWSEAKTQRRSALGTWSNKKATQICVNTGTNSQTQTVCGGGIPCSTVTLESINPGNSCSSDVKSHKSRTYHGRNNGGNFSGGFSISFTLRARGSATGQINGSNLSASPGTHTRFY